MPPAADPAATVPHVPADLAELLAEVRAMLARVAEPKPLLIKRPWEFVGVSKSSWYRLAAEGLTPGPVRLEGAGVVYRRADLEAFVAKLKIA